MSTHSHKIGTLELEAFVVSAEEESFERAARRIGGVDATTVGRRVAALETFLDVKLFVRSPSGLELTDDGRYAFAQADRIRALIDEFRSPAVGEKEKVADEYWTDNRVGRIMCRRRPG